jgi:hypothetical protein
MTEGPFYTVRQLDALRIFADLLQHLQWVMDSTGIVSDEGQVAPNRIWMQSLLIFTSTVYCPEAAIASSSGQPAFLFLIDRTTAPLFRVFIAVADETTSKIGARAFVYKPIIRTEDRDLTLSAG